MFEIGVFMGGGAASTLSPPHFRFFGFSPHQLSWTILESIFDCFCINVPSFFATYFCTTFLKNFIFCCSPSCSANPRRHAFYLRIRKIFVHAPFSEKTIFMRSISENYRNSGLFSQFFFDFHDLFGIDFCIDFYIEFRWKMGPKIDRWIVPRASPFRELQMLKYYESMDGSHLYTFYIFRNFLFSTLRKML